MGYVMAFDRLKLVPRHALEIDLLAMVNDAGVSEAGDVVDYFLARFLRAELEGSAREALVDFLRDELGGDRVERSDAATESALRSLLYLVLSTPEYQLA